MLLNNLDEQAAENPEELVVYNGMGDAARNTKALQKMIEILLELDKHHSVLVQSRKSAGIMQNCYLATGSKKKKRLPLPISLSTQILPFCAAIKSLEIASPNPEPDLLSPSDGT
jgi:hypothetical protein